jgi:hypothetical protein
MTQNEPGTAPGSQGVFGAKSVGSEMGARQLLELVLSCPVAGASAQFSDFVGSQIKQVLRLKEVGLFSQNGGQLTGFTSSVLVHTRTKMVLFVTCVLKRKTCGTSTLRWP